MKRYFFLLCFSTFAVCAMEQLQLITVDQFIAQANKQFCKGELSSDPLLVEATLKNAQELTLRTNRLMTAHLYSNSTQVYSTQFFVRRAINLSWEEYRKSLPSDVKRIADRNCDYFFSGIEEQDSTIFEMDL